MNLRGTGFAALAVCIRFSILSWYWVVFCGRAPDLCFVALCCLGKFGAQKGENSWWKICKVSVRRRGASVQML